jgi:hypothetical protein
MAEYGAALLLLVIIAGFIVSQLPRDWQTWQGFGLVLGAIPVGLLIIALLANPAAILGLGLLVGFYSSVRR